MRGWERGLWFDETGLPWINPSPNMRNLIQATVYPGIGAIEGTNISVGRGTDTPFEQLGAPWIDGVQLADALNARNIAGVRFYPVRFTPVSSKYAKEECQGVFIVVTDRSALRPVRLGLEVAAMLHKLYGVDVRAGIRRAPVRIEGHADARSRRRGSGSHRRVVGGRRGALAVAEGEVPAVPVGSCTDGEDGGHGTGSTRRDYERAAAISSFKVSKPKGGSDDRSDPPGNQCKRADVVCGV